MAFTAAGGDGLIRTQPAMILAKWPAIAVERIPRCRVPSGIAIRLFAISLLVKEYAFRH
jgi:hypothetical protein